MRVLLFDSDSDNTKSFLERAPEGLEVIHVKSEDEAYDRINDEDPSTALLILDYDALGGKFDEITERMLNDFPETLRFALTSQMDADTMREHQKSVEGADGYFKLPIKSSLLQKIFEQYGISGLVAKPDPQPEPMPMNEQEQEILEQTGMHTTGGPMGDQGLSDKIQAAFNYAFGSADAAADDFSLGDTEEGLIMSDDNQDDGIDLSGAATQEIDLSGADDAGIDLSGEATEEAIDLSGSVDAGIDLSGEATQEAIDLGGDEPADAGIDLNAADPGELDLSGAADPGEIDLGGGDEPTATMMLNDDEGGMDLGEVAMAPESMDIETSVAIEVDDSMDISLADETEQESQEIDLGIGDEVAVDFLGEDETGALDLGGESEGEAFSMDDSLAVEDTGSFNADVGGDNITVNASGDDLTMSDDAKDKLAELDAYLDETADQVAPNPEEDDLGVDLGASEPEQVDDLLKAFPSMDATTTTALSAEDIAEMAPSVADELSEPTEQFEQPVEQTISEPVAAAPVNPAPSFEEHQEVVSHNTQELHRLADTIQNLREDRERLQKKVDELENKQDYSKQDYLSLKSELDEKKIEVTVLKRQYEEKIDEFQYKLKLSEERRGIADEKQKQYLSDIENLNQKVRLDIKRIQSRERELESQLELLKTDAEIQIKNRDNKIIELKRKIDSLEFEMESVHNNEEKQIQGRLELEDKLTRVMKTLRAALNLLDETSLAEIESLKKDLDV